MKLTMRAIALGKKISLITTAFVLAVSTLTAAVPFVLAQNASAATIHTSSLPGGWDFSKTRTKGHYELVNGGLHIWTDEASSLGKVAGYKDVNFPLSTLGTPEISYLSTTGQKPGVNLAVDLDNNGSFDGYLVGEETFAPNLWLSESNPDIQSAAPLDTTQPAYRKYWGSLGAWNTAFPNAVVTQVGFSLGSGAQGDAVISKITAGGNDYTFSLPPNQAPVVNFVAPTPDNAATVRGTITTAATITDDNGIAASYLRVWKNAYEIAGGGQLVGNCQNVPGGNLLGTSTTPTCAFDTTTVADGTKLFISAQTEDSNGATASAPIRILTVDNTAPTLTVKPESVGNTSTKVFSNVSFKLYDAYKIDKIVINGYVKELTNNTYSDANFANIKAHFVQGQNTVTAYDVAGNTTSYTFTYDSDVPTVRVNLNRAAYVASGDSVRSASVPEIEAFDKTLTKIEITKKSDGAYVTAWTNVVQNVTTRKGISWVGQGTYLIRAYDDAGLVSAPFELTIDNTAPTATFGFSNNNGNAVTNQDVTVTMTASEPIQTPADWTKVDATHFTRTYSANGKYSVIVTDLAGNVSGEQKYEVKRIDKVAPVVTGVAANGVYRGDVTFNVNDQNFNKLYVNDAQVATTHPGGWDYVPANVLSGNGTYNVKVTDKGGNETFLTIQIDNSMISTFEEIDEASETPILAGVLSYVADGAILPNTDVVIDVDGGDPYYTTTDENGRWTTPVLVTNGAHTATVSLVNGDSTTTPVASKGFTTTLIVDETDPPVQPGTNNGGEGEGEGEPTTETEGEPQPLVLPATVNPTLFNQVLGTNTEDEATDDESADNSGVEGTSVEKNLAQAVGADNTDGNALGLAWYWWLIIIAGGAAGIWWLIAALRGRSAE